MVHKSALFAPTEHFLTGENALQMVHLVELTILALDKKVSSAMNWSFYVIQYNDTVYNILLY